MDLGSLAPKVIETMSDVASRVVPPNFAWPITDPIKAFFKNRFGTRPRITMLEMIEVARSKFGWKIADDSLDLLDLASGIRQAAIDGEITLFGRFSTNSNLGSLIDYYPIINVPIQHLKEHHIDVITFKQNNNVTMSTYRPGQAAKESFCDLRLHRQQSLYWLRTTGSEWKGRSDRRQPTSPKRN
jgi:hypothetical protein